MLNEREGCVAGEDLSFELGVWISGGVEGGHAGTDASISR